MTELIRSQLIIILTMLYCGLCAGLIGGILFMGEDNEKIEKQFKGIRKK